MTTVLPETINVSIVIDELKNASTLEKLYEIWEQYNNTLESKSDDVGRRFISLVYWNLRACFLIDELSEDQSLQTIETISVALVAIKMADLYASFLRYYRQDVYSEALSLKSRAVRLKKILQTYGQQHPESLAEVITRVLLLNKVINRPEEA